MIKRIFAITVLLMLTAVTFVFSAVNNQDIPEGDDHATILIALGIIDSKPKANVKISRADFVSAVIHCMYEELSITHDTLPFSDIDGNRHRSELSLAADLGLISGTSDGKFEPSAAITLEQGTKIAVAALGYKSVAEHSGGYPQGYLQVAMDKGLLRGVNVGLGAEIDRIEAAKIFYNLIRANIAVPTAYTNNKMEMSVKGGETILSFHRNIYRISGIVTQTPQTSLTGDSTVGEGEVAIDETVYEAADTEKYLGMCVTAYVHIPPNGSSIGTVRYIAPNSSITSTLTIDGEDITDVPDGLKQVVYEEAERNREVRISPIVKIVYNGKAYPECTEEELKEITGSITLIDNNGDRVYDVISVKAYEMLVVGRVSLTDRRVYNKYTYTGALPFVDFDISSGEGFYSITYRNKPAELDSISEWDVLAVLRARSGSKRLVTVEIIKSTDEGVIDEMFNSPSTIEGGIVISGRRYNYSREYVNAHNELDPFSVKITVGENRWFSLDKFGKIAAVRTDAPSNIQYGYLLNIAADEGISGEVKAKILTEIDQWEILTLAQNVLLDGAKAKGEDVISAVSSSVAVVPQVVRYKTGAEGMIVEIDTATPTDTMIKDTFTQTGPKTDRYRHNNTSFESNIYLRASTAVFMIPEAGVTDEVDCRVTNYGDLVSDRSYNFIAYDIDEFRFASAVLILASESDLKDPTGGMLMVDRLVSALANNESVIKLYGNMANYTDIAALGKDNSIFNGLNRGDVISFHVNQEGRIDAVYPVYEIKDGIHELNPTTLHASRVYIAGVIANVDSIEGRVLLDFPTTSVSRALKLAIDLPMIRHDYKTKKTSRISLSDLEIGDYVIFRANNSSIAEGMAIRF